MRVRFGEAWEEIAAREVVLCAGAIHSPCILMRSGIGPAAALRALGIGGAARPAGGGQHLMDHPILRATIALQPAAPREGCRMRATPIAA